MQQTLAYTALDDAEIAFERIGRDPALERFIRIGAACTCSAVCLACQELAATIGLTLTTCRDDVLTQPPKSPVDRTAS